MSSDNFTVQTGNLTNDPELRYTNNGTAVANFGLAINTRIKDADGSWRDGDTHFFRVNVWRDQAENVTESLSKGNRAGPVEPALEEGCPWEAKLAGRAVPRT